MLHVAIILAAESTKYGISYIGLQSMYDDIMRTKDCVNHIYVDWNIFETEHMASIRTSLGMLEGEPSQSLDQSNNVPILPHLDP